MARNTSFFDLCTIRFFLWCVGTRLVRYPRDRVVTTLEGRAVFVRNARVNSERAAFRVANATFGLKTVSR